MRKVTKLIFLQFCIIFNLSANPLDMVGVSSAPVGAVADMITKPYKLIRIIKSGGCAHHFVLSPKEAMQIKSLNIIFAINRNFERFLRKDSFKNVYELSTIQKIDVMDDWHIWLNLKNLRIIGKFIMGKIVEIDPVNSKTYLKNLEDFYSKIDELEKKFKKYQKHKIVSEKKLLHFFQNFDNSNEIRYNPFSYFENTCKMPFKIDPENFGNKNIVEHIDSLIEDFRVCVGED